MTITGIKERMRITFARAAHLIRGVAICLFLVVLCALPTPMPGKAAGAVPGCDPAVTTPQLCQIAYADSNPILLVKGSGFTPKAAVRVEIGYITGGPINTLSLQTSASGVIEAIVFNECLPAKGQAVAIDTTTGRKSQPLAVPTQPACMSLIEARLSAMQSGLSVPPDSAGAPSTCDLEATTPTICGTHFNGTSTKDGSLDVYGSGFTPGKPVHVRVEGSEFSSVSFDAVASAHGLLISTTPKSLPCYTSPITITVVDAASKAHGGKVEDSACLMVKSSSGSGGGGWHITIIPIGLIIAVVSGLIRKSRRALG